MATATIPAFLGELVNEGMTWRFPIINSVNQHGKQMMWMIELRLRDAITGDLLPIMSKYYDNEPMDDIYAEYYTTYGQVGGKMQTTDAKQVKCGKNLNKKNHTNAFTQAMSEAQSTHASYLKKHSEHRAPTDNQIADTSSVNVQTITDTVGDLSIAATSSQGIIRPPPMLLNLYGRVIKEADGISKLVQNGVKLQFGVEAKYDVFIQRKINDIRVVAYMTGDGKLDVYTRMKTSIAGFDGIKQELFFLLSHIRTPNVYLDGGFYKHGLSLQELSGIVRNQQSNDVAEEGIVFNIFDIFGDFTNASELDGKISRRPYVERKHLLEDYFAKAESAYLNLHKSKFKHISLLETKLVKSEADVMREFDQYVSDGYEGAILRRSDGEYKLSRNGQRTSYVLKVKQRHDAEFEIVGFKCGTGNHTDAIIWQLKTKDGHIFDAVPLGEISQRVDLYRELSTNIELFPDNYLGRMMTVQYEELSDIGVPMRAQAVVLREGTSDYPL